MLMSCFSLFIVGRLLIFDDTVIRTQLNKRHIHRHQSLVRVACYTNINHIAVEKPEQELNGSHKTNIFVEPLAY